VTRAAVVLMEAVEAPELPRPTPVPVRTRGASRRQGSRPAGVELKAIRDDVSGEIVVYAQFAGGEPDFLPLVLMAPAADCARSRAMELRRDQPEGRVSVRGRGGKAAFVARFADVPAGEYVVMLGPDEF
jgi:hypothetical protein